MKSKQLIKKSRDLPEDVLRHIIESKGVLVEDHFLVGATPQESLMGWWGADGKPAIRMQFDGDEVYDLATRLYLVSKGVPVYPDENAVPEARPANTDATIFAGE